VVQPVLCWGTTAVSFPVPSATNSNVRAESGGLYLFSLFFSFPFIFYFGT